MYIAVSFRGTLPSQEELLTLKLIFSLLTRCISILITPTEAPTNWLFSDMYYDMWYILKMLTFWQKFEDMQVRFWRKKLRVAKFKGGACMKKLIHARSRLAWTIPVERAEASKACVVN